VGLLNLWLGRQSATPEQLLKTKLAMDLGNSVMRSPHALREATTMTAGFLKASRLFSPTRFSMVDVVPDAPESWLGQRIASAIETLGDAAPSVVSCPCTSAGPLAALALMQSKFRVNLTIDYRAGSAQQQMRLVHRNEGLYDFLVTGTYALMFRSEIPYRDYLVLFPCTFDNQFLLHRSSAGTVAQSDPIKLLREASKVYFVPETGNEAYLRVTGIKSNWEIELADLLTLPSELDFGEVLLAFEPNATALIRQYKLNPLWDSSIAIPLILCCQARLFRHRDFCKAAARVRAFCALFIAAWNYCDRHRGEAESALLSLPEILDLFARGGTLAKAS
jgi:hypothetical protein